MSRAQFHADNHFIPSVYLKHFTDGRGKVLTYRTLVPHPKIPLWKDTSPEGVAYIRHLYTRVAASVETDEIEKWLDRDFEHPAEEALSRAVSDQKLNPRHWGTLSRFVAAQTVRTPAFFVRNLDRWRKDVPVRLNSVLADTVQHIETAKQLGQSLQQLKPHPLADYLPFRVSAEKSPDGNKIRMKLEAAAGRGLWHFAMRHILANTITSLDHLKWSIVRPYQGLTWFTSDDPVIALNYKDNGTYDFGGGWGQKRVEILLPISPFHLLYSCVGERPLPRGTMIDRITTERIRGLIAEHAYRSIFSNSRDGEIPNLRRRE